MLFYIHINERVLDRLFIKYQMALSFVLCNFKKINTKFEALLKYVITYVTFFPCVFYNFSQLKIRTKPQFRSYSFFVFLIVSYNFNGPMNMNVISWNPVGIMYAVYFMYKYADSISRMFSSSPSLSPWSHSFILYLLPTLSAQHHYRHFVFN